MENMVAEQSELVMTSFSPFNIQFNEKQEKIVYLFQYIINTQAIHVFIQNLLGSTQVSKICFKNKTSENVKNESVLCFLNIRNRTQVWWMQWQGQWVSCFHLFKPLQVNSNCRKNKQNLNQQMFFCVPGWRSGPPSSPKENKSRAPCIRSGKAHTSSRLDTKLKSTYVPQCTEQTKCLKWQVLLTFSLSVNQH